MKTWTILLLAAALTACSGGDTQGDVPNIGIDDPPAPVVDDGSNPGTGGGDSDTTDNFDEGAVSNIDAAEQLDGSILVTWEDSVTGEGRFEVFRRIVANQEQFIVVGEVSANSTQFRDSDTAVFGTYRYFVQSVGPRNERPSNARSDVAEVERSGRSTLEVGIGLTAPVAVETRNANDSAATAQIVPGDGIFIGQVSNSDTSDFYEAVVFRGQTVTLRNFDVDASSDEDADLVVQSEDGSFIEVSDASGANEQITFPADGRYTIQVTQFSGEVEYLLEFNPPGAPAGTTRLSDQGYTKGGAPRTGEIVLMLNNNPAGAQLAATIAGLPVAGSLAERLLDSTINGVSAPSWPILGLVDSLNPDPIAALHASLPLQALGISVPQNLHPVVATARIAKRLESLTGVKSAGINRTAKATSLNTSDPSAFSQWNMAEIHLEEGWNVGGTRGSGFIIVATIDGGYFLGHPDFSGAQAPTANGDADGFDFVNNDTCPDTAGALDPDNPECPGVRTDYSHGTHVAGLITARADNGEAIAGTMPEGLWLPVQALSNDTGEGDTFSVFSALLYSAALENAFGVTAANPAKIVNLSLTLPPDDQTSVDLLEDVTQSGLTVVWSAGNESMVVNNYPAIDVPGVVVVGATNGEHDLASYSNSGTAIDLVAPGGSDDAAEGPITSLGGFVVIDSQSGEPENRFSAREFVGTSFASPHVAGVFGLMASLDPGIPPAGIEFLLQSGDLSTEIGIDGPDDLYGYGLIDAEVSQRTMLDTLGQEQPGGQGVLRASTRDLDYGAIETVLRVEFSVDGTATGGLRILEIPRFMAADAVSVDEDGFGTYDIRIDRSLLTTNGTNRDRLLVRAGQSELAMSVKVSRSEAGGFEELLQPELFAVVQRADGTLLEDGSSSAACDVELTASVLSVDCGELPIELYTVTVSTDRNGDGVLCEAGDICGILENVGAPADPNAAVQISLIR